METWRADRRRRRCSRSLRAIHSCALAETALCCWQSYNEDLEGGEAAALEAQAALAAPQLPAGRAGGAAGGRARGRTRPRGHGQGRAKAARGWADGGGGGGLTGECRDAERGCLGSGAPSWGHRAHTLRCARGSVAGRCLRCLLKERCREGLTACWWQGSTQQTCAAADRRAPVLQAPSASARAAPRGRGGACRRRRPSGTPAAARACRRGTLARPPARQQAARLRRLVLPIVSPLCMRGGCFVFCICPAEELWFAAALLACF